MDSDTAQGGKAVKSFFVDFGEKVPQKGGEGGTRPLRKGIHQIVGENLRFGKSLFGVPVEIELQKMEDLLFGQVHGVLVKGFVRLVQTVPQLLGPGHSLCGAAACAGKLLSDFNGEVPRTIEELTSLPGVGRKTANVIRGNVYEDPSIVVDTHVKRVTNRLGLTDETEPEKVERDLMKVLPKDHWILINLQGIKLGREICKAPTPRCQECFLTDCCRKIEKERKGR